MARAIASFDAGGRRRRSGDAASSSAFVGCQEFCMKRKSPFSDDALHSDQSLRTIRIVPRRTSSSIAAPSEGTLKVGEARVRVKLTNAGDEVLVRRGLLAQEQVRSYEADALIDTGAVRSVLPIQVVQVLGLPIVGKARATHANDASEDVDITEVVGINIMGRRTTEET